MPGLDGEGESMEAKTTAMTYVPRRIIGAGVLFLLLACGHAAFAKVIVYPIPEGVKVNDAYSVRIRPLGGTWRKVGIYNVEVRTGWDTKTDSSMAYFDCNEPVEIEVTRNTGKIDRIDLRPKRLQLKPKQVREHSFRFIMNEPKKISVEINGDIYDNLHIFARYPESDPITAESDEVVYFGPGYHRLDKPLNLESRKTLYIAGGAFIEVGLNNDTSQGAHVRGESLSDVTLRGRGIIYMPGPSFGDVHGPQGLRLRRCSRVKVDGITLIKQSRGWTNCIQNNTDVAYTDVALISVGRNGDGIDVVGGRDIVVDNCFVRASDDALCIKTWSIDHDLDHVVFKNCTAWNDITSHPIEIGFELRSSYARNIAFQNIDIPHSNGQHPPTSDFGTIDISHGDNAILSNVLFEGIHIENIHSPDYKLISCSIVHDPTWSLAAGDRNRGRGKDIVFRNIFYAGDAESKISGYNSTHGFDGITFENFHYNGQVATSPAEANLTIGDFVKTVSFKKSKVPNR